MLTFMNSKLPDDWQKRKSYEISNTDIYIGEGLVFIIHVFYFTGISHQTTKSIKCKKKTSNPIKVISSYNICSGIES